MADPADEVGPPAARSEEAEVADAIA
jgi:hypothetical protein